MLSSVAALGFAFVSLVVAILTFMLGGTGNRTVRVVAGVIFLSLAFIFFLIGLFPFFPSSLPTTVSSQPQSGATIEDLGLWEWGTSRPPMPEPAGVNQVIFAHGDIDNSGRCHVTEFGTGITVQGLGEGTFRLVRITGTPEQIRAAELEIQQIAANGAGGSCPWK
jgi:hypothetical protein